MARTKLGCRNSRRSSVMGFHNRKFPPICSIFLLLSCALPALAESRDSGDLDIPDVTTYSGHLLSVNFTMHPVLGSENVDIEIFKVDPPKDNLNTDTKAVRQEPLPPWLYLNKTSKTLEGIPESSEPVPFLFLVEAKCRRRSPNCVDRQTIFQMNIINRKWDRPFIKNPSLTFKSFEFGRTPSGVGDADGRAECSDDKVVSSLILCKSLKHLSAVKRIQLVRNLAHFLSIPDNIIGLESSSTQNLKAVEFGFQIISAGPGSGDDCAMKENIEVMWRLPCEVVKHLSDFVKVLQHNVDGGRIHQETGLDVLGWYVASSDSLLTRKHRRRRNAESSSTIMPTPTLEPQSPTPISSSMEYSSSLLEHVTSSKSIISSSQSYQHSTLLSSSSSVQDSFRSPLVSSSLSSTNDGLLSSDLQSKLYSSSFPPTDSLSTVYTSPRPSRTQQNKSSELVPSNSISNINKFTLMTSELRPSALVSSTPPSSASPMPHTSAFPTPQSVSSSSKPHSISPIYSDPVESTTPHSLHPSAVSSIDSGTSKDIPFSHTRLDVLSSHIVSLSSSSMAKTDVHSSYDSSQMDYASDIVPSQSPPSPSVDDEGDSHYPKQDSSFDFLTSRHPKTTPLLTHHDMASDINLQFSTSKEHDMEVSISDEIFIDSFSLVIKPSDVLHTDIISDISSASANFRVSQDLEASEYSSLDQQDSTLISSSEFDFITYGMAATPSSSPPQSSPVDENVLSSTWSLSVLSSSHVTAPLHATSDSVLLRSSMHPYTDLDIVASTTTPDQTQSMETTGGYDTTTEAETTEAETTEVTTTESPTTTTTLTTTTATDGPLETTEATSLEDTTCDWSFANCRMTGSSNSGPRVQNPIGLIIGEQGRVLELTVSRDVFSDEEDGDTMSLSLDLEFPSGKKVPSDFWLYLVTIPPQKGRSNSIQLLKGLPLHQDMDIKNVSVVLVATDSGGLQARDSIILQINDSPRTQFTHRFTLRFAIDFQEFIQRRGNIVELMGRLASHFNDSSAGFVTVLEVRKGSFILSWTNNTLSGPVCQRQAIKRLLYKMVRKDRTVRSSFNRKIGRHLELLEIKFEPLGSCIIPSTTTPVTTTVLRSSKVAQGLSLWAHVILPILIALVVFILILFLIFVCNRRRKRQQALSIIEKDAFSNDRNPIIFPNELESDDPILQPKTPLVLPTDSNSPNSSPQHEQLPQPQSYQQQEQQQPQLQHQQPPPQHNKHNKHRDHRGESGGKSKHKGPSSSSSSKSKKDHEHKTKDKIKQKPKVDRVRVSISSTVSSDRPNNHYIEEDDSSVGSTVRSSKSGNGSAGQSPTKRQPPPYWQAQKHHPPPYRLPPPYLNDEQPQAQKPASPEAPVLVASCTTTQV